MEGDCFCWHQQVSKANDDDNNNHNNNKKALPVLSFLSFCVFDDDKTSLIFDDGVNGMGWVQKSFEICSTQFIIIIIYYHHQHHRPRYRNEWKIIYCYCTRHHRLIIKKLTKRYLYEWRRNDLFDIYLIWSHRTALSFFYVPSWNDDGLLLRSCHTHKKAKKYQPTKFTKIQYLDGMHLSIVCNESGLTKRKFRPTVWSFLLSLSLSPTEKKKKKKNRLEMGLHHQKQKGLTKTFWQQETNRHTTERLFVS